MIWSIILAVISLGFVGAAHAETFAFEVYAVDGSKRELISTNQKHYAASDIKITEKTGRGKRFLDKELYLDNGFTVGLSDHFDRRVTGFGCWLRRLPSPVKLDQYGGFSWEWFDQKDGELFEKRKGDGVLRVSVRSIDDREVIEKIEFLTDTQFQLNTIRDGKPGEYTHEMKILKGSVLVFPDTRYLTLSEYQVTFHPY